MKKIILKESELIKLINLITEDWDKLNKILEKISSSGINSLTKKEKEYLDYYSKTEKFLDDDELMTSSDRVPSGEIWNFDGFQGIPKMSYQYETTEESIDEIIHTGYFTIKNDQYYGEIYCDTEGNFSLCNFESDEGENLFEKYEGLEREIEIFLSTVCDDLKGDLMT